MISKEKYDELIELKCNEEGCFNYCEQGYIYCQGHLRGFPQRMSEKDIKDIKEFTKSKDGEDKNGR